jgi:DNA mismatch repair ATPase MutS
MFKRTLALYTACAILLNPIFVIATDEVAKEISLPKYICSQYLTSTFGAETSVVPPANNENLTFFEKFNQQFDTKRQTLTPREAQEIAFTLTASSKDFSTDIIDSSCIEKLNLVSGGENSEQHILHNLFKEINTTFGIAHAALSLCHPTTDISILQNKQQAILLLNTDIELTEKIDSILKSIQKHETKSLLAWSSKAPVNEDILKFFYFGKNFDYNNILKTLNTYTLPLEFTNKTFQIGMLALGIAYMPTFIALNFRDIAKQLGMSPRELYEYVKANITPEQKAATAMATIFTAGIQGFMAYNSYKSLQATGETINHLQDLCIATASHIDELKKLSSLINTNKELLTYLPSLQPLADLNNPAKHSAKLKKFLGMLETNTFKGEPSFWSVSGRVLAAYELMKQVKDELAPAFAAAGELDMYVALAKLYNDHENKNARYCMVDFVENSTTPIIKAHNFWNPFIDADKVVVKDVTFDLSCPNSILTGANTGGKSTVIKAIMLDILMAQTFGIAPATSLSITPFSKLNCFMNISDDIATGASLFKSEVMRAKKLLDLVQSLKKDEFSFVIIDEVFTGTSPQEGEQAAVRFAKHMGTYGNNISIIATHYPKMADLETDTNGNYRNLHVEILRNEDGSLNRTFKLKNGPTFENVAFDILQEEELFI